VWGVLVLLVGLFVLVLAIREVVHQHRLKRAGILVQGTVVHHRVSYSKEGATYFAIVEFLDQQGVRHSFQAGSSGVKRLPIGSAVPVRYLPGPQPAARIFTSKRIGDVVGLSLGALVFSGAGILMLVQGR
jgi:hypothetical protein